jgi:hypothetical protein
MTSLQHIIDLLHEPLPRGGALSAVRASPGFPPGVAITITALVVCHCLCGGWAACFTQLWPLEGFTAGAA